jgi:tripartite-type tricarboxylate transporter receptor subunit TctC
MQLNAMNHMNIIGQFFCTLAAITVAGTAGAQAYPAKPLRLIAPTSPGGGSDIFGRQLAQKLSESFGQQVIVENRAGAGGIIGIDYVAKAAADGYTLLIAPAGLAINPSMYAKLPYDTLRDLAPVTQLADAPSVLTVHPSVPATSVKQLIALAKARPGLLTGGTAGIGSAPHLSLELFKSMAKIDVVFAHYKGLGQGMVSLLSGEIALMTPTALTVIQHLRNGKLRALGVTTLKRAAVLPEVPTIAESGLPGYDAPQWYGLLTTAGTPAPVIDRLHRETARVLAQAEMKQRLEADGTRVVAGTPAEFARYLKNEIDKWAGVIRSAGIKPE